MRTTLLALSLCLPWLGLHARAQGSLRSDGAHSVQEGATTRSLSDSLRLCTLSDEDVDLYLASVEMLVLVLPSSPQLRQNLRAKELALATLGNHPVWLAIDGGIDCRDFVCVAKKIAIALPLSARPDARPDGYRSANLTLIRNRLEEITAAMESLRTALSGDELELQGEE